MDDGPSINLYQEAKNTFANTYTYINNTTIINNK